MVYVLLIHIRPNYGTENKKKKGEKKVSCPKISMIDLWEKSKKINETISCL